LSFCAYFKRCILPADLDTICCYAQFLSRTVTPPTIRNYLSGVKIFHILLGYEYNFTSNYILKLVLRGLSRLHPHTPLRAPPMTPEILLKVASVIDVSSSFECTIFSCALFLFFLMARLGNVLPCSTNSAVRLYLLSKSISFSPEGLLVTFKHTKTIQFGQRLLHLPLLTIQGSVLCPVAAYHRARYFLRGHSAKAAFMFLCRGRVTLLTQSQFLKTFRALLARAGIPHATCFRGHSFRRGGASWAFQSGVPGEVIQICGDWISDAYKLYLEFSMHSKVIMASSMARDIVCS